MLENNDIVECMVCGEPFAYSVEFYQQRDFDPPKRCPKHAAEYRNRKAKGRKVCLLQLDNVLLDIPDAFVSHREHMTKTDRGVTNITCCKFKLRPFGCYGGTYFTVYDHRNKGEKIFMPLHGDRSKASLRVMLAEEGYEYLVLDTAAGGQIEAVLEVGMAPVPMDDNNRSLWQRHGLSMDGHTSHKWLLTVQPTEGSLGDEICQLLRSVM